MLLLIQQLQLQLQLQYYYNAVSLLLVVADCVERKSLSSSSMTESRWKQRGSCLTLPTPGRAHRFQSAVVVPVRTTSRPSSTVVGRRTPSPPALLGRTAENRSAAAAADPVDDVDRFFLVTDV